MGKGGSTEFVQKPDLHGGFVRPRAHVEDEPGSRAAGVPSRKPAIGQIDARCGTCFSGASAVMGNAAKSQARARSQDVEAAAVRRRAHSARPRLGRRVDQSAPVADGPHLAATTVNANTSGSI